MKKIILTIISILTLSTTSIISTSAFMYIPDFLIPNYIYSAAFGWADKKRLEKQRDDIKAIYDDIFHNYKYDEDLGIQAQELSRGKTLKEIFECDIKFMEEHRGGTCHQFANLFINRLTNIGIKAYALIMADSKDLIESHTTVVYEFDGEKYVTNYQKSRNFQKF